MPTPHCRRTAPDPALSELRARVQADADTLVAFLLARSAAWEAADDNDRLEAHRPVVARARTASAGRCLGNQQRP